MNKAQQLRAKKPRTFRSPGSTFVPRALDTSALPLCWRRLIHAPINVKCMSPSERFLEAASCSPGTYRWSGTSHRRAPDSGDRLVYMGYPLHGGWHGREWVHHTPHEVIIGTELARHEFEIRLQNLATESRIWSAVLVHRDDGCCVRGKRGWRLPVRGCCGEPRGAIAFR